MLRIDEKSFFCIILSYNPSWSCKLLNTFATRKIVNLFTIHKVDLKCDCSEEIL